MLADISSTTASRLSSPKISKSLDSQIHVSVIDVIRRIVDRQEAESRSLLVLDANTGQNGILQAKAFADAAGLDGIIVTKLDGTARGGVVFSIVGELGAPVVFVGTGEKVEDISAFDPETFVDALFQAEG